MLEDQLTSGVKLTLKIFTKVQFEGFISVAMALVGESHDTIKHLVSHAEEALLSNTNSQSNYTTARPTEIPCVLDTDLVALTRKQRLAFEITVGTLCVLSLCGNFSTLFVNFRRKMRPFFRTCLISLAISDLLSTIFLTWTHFPQFTAEYVQIWTLGSFMCRFIPLITTAAILASSMTLVGIAVDRYFAVMKAIVSYWNPGVTFCCFFAFAIWVASIGIAMPVCFIYRILRVWILTEVSFPDEELTTIADSDYVPFYTQTQPKELVAMCVSDQKDVALYYIIVFSLIFVPCIVAFVWLNSIIARKIWIRRHRPPPQTDQFTVNNSKQNSPTARDPSKSGLSSSSAAKPPGYKSPREARHMRMFIVILVLMTVFIAFRLPAWIFLVMRMYGNYAKPHDWIVYFSFGVLNLASCALNPLFYTFLPETLQYVICCKKTLCTNTCELASEMDATNCKVKNCLRTTQCETEVPCCICCGVFCRFSSAHTCSCARTQKVSSTRENSHPSRPVSFEHDEGVDCSDSSFEAENYEVRKEEICIVFTTAINQQPEQERY